MNQEYKEKLSRKIGQNYLDLALALMGATSGKMWSG